MNEDSSHKKSHTASAAGKVATSLSSLLGFVSLIAALALASAAFPRAATAQTPKRIAEGGAPFEGRIGRTVKDSTPDFPKGIEAPVGAPNILLILTDDVGFGASSTFGGPIQTPNFQQIADSGLRYNMFHTTALCSPTRAALITGRNHHSVASGVITEFATGYPGYNSLVPKSASSVGAVLRLERTATTRHGSAKCTTCRTGCRARQARLICGRMVSASSIFMDSLAVTASGAIGPTRQYPCHFHDGR
jgi:arylsulfatase